MASAAKGLSSRVEGVALAASADEVPPMRLLSLLLAAVLLSGCAVAALPFRVTGDVLDVVPVVGPIAAAPFKATADVID